MEVAAKAALQWKKVAYPAPRPLFRSAFGSASTDQALRPLRPLPIGAFSAYQIPPGRQHLLPFQPLRASYSGSLAAPRVPPVHAGLGSLDAYAISWPRHMPPRLNPHGASSPANTRRRASTSTSTAVSPSAAHDIKSPSVDRPPSPSLPGRSRHHALVP